jgi:hypothetical protein
MRKVGEAVKDGWQPIAAEAQNLRMAQIDFRFLLPEVDALVDEAGSLYDRIIGADPADHRCDFWRRWKTLWFWQVSASASGWAPPCTSRNPLSFHIIYSSELSSG